MKTDVQKRQTGVLLLLIALAFAVKSIHITAPFLGHFSSYQVVMAMIAENFRAEHFSNLLLPKLFSIQDGARALELIYYSWCSLIAAIGQAIFGGSMEFWGRFQAVFFSSLSAIPLFCIVRKIGKPQAALWTVLLFLFSPMVLVYGRSFQNESICLFFLLSAIAVLLSNPSNLFKLIFSALLFSIASAGRQHFMVFLPLFWLIVLLDSFNLKTIIRIFVFSVIALSLPAVWLAYSYQMSLVDPHVHSNVFVQVASGKTFPNPLFLNPDFYKKVADLLLNRVLTPVGFVFFISGLFLLPIKNRSFLFLWFWMALSLSVTILIPLKVYDHGFYLIPFVPVAAIFAGEAISIFIERAKTSAVRFVSLFVVALIWLALVARFYVPAAFFIPKESKNVPSVGKWVSDHTQPGDWVIAAYRTSPELLYYCHRNGWGFLMSEKNRKISQYWKVKALSHMTDEERARREEDFKSPVTWLERLRSEGAKYFVASDKNEYLSNPVFSGYMQSHYSMISKPDDDFVFFDLQKKS